MSNNIKVICRFRPQNAIELRNNGVPIVDIDDQGQTVKINGQDFQGSFTFDRIFGTRTSQEELFDYSIKSTVEDVFNGYNGTVFAYGQTGSGKTFTMMGADLEKPELRGIIPRIVQTIFSTIVDSPSHMEYTVKVSYMEIYMEKIRDLLNPQNDNLPIHEERSKGVYVKGLCEVYVSSIDEVFEVMRQGSNARVVAYTNMNAESSRSHSIFVITISQKNLNDGKVKMGHLYLVDLAGSEKVGKTGASGKVLEEAKKINGSLSALGMVINALTDGKSSHIPYRDSKLTRILQESLGGNSRTTLIINCSPSSYNDAETVSTLRFGMRAKTIKNKAKVNQDLSPTELKKLLKVAKTRELTFQTYITALEGEVKVWRSGGLVSPEHYASMERIKNGKLITAPPAKEPLPNGVSPAPATMPPPSDASSPTSPSLAARGSGAATPVSLDTVMADMLRPGTPAVGVNEDEREEFLRRENELTDQLAEKESELSGLQKQTEAITGEVEFLKEEGMALSKENKELSQDLQQLQVQLDRITHANREAQITIDSTKLSNAELTSELANLKQQLTELSLTHADSTTRDKQKRKEEKMAQMMAELDQTTGYSQQGEGLGDVLQSLTISTNGDHSRAHQQALHDLEQQLDAKTREVEKRETTLQELRAENRSLAQKCKDLSSKLTALEHEFEELLDNTIAEEEARSSIDIVETIQEVKHRLEEQYKFRQEELTRELEVTQLEVEKRTTEIEGLHDAVDELKRVNCELRHQLEEEREQLSNSGSVSPTSTVRPDHPAPEREIEMLKRTMVNKLKEFEVMRKAMMRDLQIRCEKIIELEVALDEARDENSMLRRKSVNSIQQQKTAILEKNIAQLTSIQKELVDQNTNLKKENAMAERKLAARNERIESLEALLLDTQDKMANQRQKYETQMQVLKEKLGQPRTAAKPQAASSYMQNFSFGRIAKPLRGGGGGGSTNNGSAATIGGMVSSLTPVPESPSQSSTPATPTPSKRTSWLNWSR